MIGAIEALSLGLRVFERQVRFEMHHGWLTASEESDDQFRARIDREMQKSPDPSRDPGR